MARKKSPGCGTVIIGLIALAMAAKYWYVLVAIGFAALAIWGIVKLTRSWSTPETPDKNTLINQQLPQNNSGLLGKTLDRNNANSKVDQVNAVIEKDLATVRAAAEVAIKQQTAEKATIRERVAQVNAEIEQILATEKAAASAVIAAENAADAEVVANQITDTPAPIVISAFEANSLINQHTPQKSPELLEKALDRNNTNSKADQVNALIEKDLAKEKAAAEVAIKIVNRLETALVDTDIRRILDAKKVALQERVSQVNAEMEKVLEAEKKVQVIKRLLAVLECISTQRILDSEKVAMRERVDQVNTEIEQILATEKSAASAVIAAEKAAAAEVTVKESAFTNRLGAALVDAEIERILEAEKAASQERVALVDSEIGRDLSTENAIDIPAEIDKTEKQIEKRIGHFIDNGNGTVTDTCTELTWMRYAMGQAKDGIAKNTYTWDKVMAFRYSFAGHDDWRLPTRDELKSIVDPRRENPAINTEVFPQTVNSWFWSSTAFVGRSGYVWVISFHNGRNNYLKRNTENFVRLVRGGQNVGHLDQKSTEHLVTLAAPAAVSCENSKTPSETKAATDLDEINEKAALQERISARQILDVGKAVLQEGTAQINSEIGSSPITENTTTTPVDNDKTDNSVKNRIGHFIDNGDGTVTDSRNGLIWMRFAMGQTWNGSSCQGKADTYTLNNAMALRHTFAGYDDWRLPTRDELASIVDLNRKNPAINIDALPQIAGSWFWSSSLNSNHTHSAWSTNFESGHVISHCSGYIRGDDNLFVRLVRGGPCVNVWDTEATVPVGSTLILPGNNINVGMERAHLSGTTHDGISNPLFPLLNGIKSTPPEFKTPEMTQIIDSEAVTPFDSFEKEVAEAMKQYDFVLVNKLGRLKTGDQWFEETTQKRRLKTGSVKTYEWLLPFMPLEVAKLCELEQIVAWGLNSVSAISKQLRVLIRERRKNKDPYDDLLSALYSSCILTDFVKTLNFEGPVNKMACNIDIHELHNIHIDYSTMGYHYIESLLKTDIKWLLEVFGEPFAHKSFDALWPSIRQNAVSRYCWKELRISNESASSYRRAETSMVEWLRNRVSSNLRYYRESWARRNEWLGRNNEWLEQKIAREPQFAAKPVAVKTASFVKQRGYAIPAPPKLSHRFSLDMSSIEAKLAETVAVSAILKDIFSEDIPVPPQTAGPESPASEVSIAGLDDESFTFMQALASKRIWTRDELEKLADRHSLMLDGTLDNINDASFDHFGGPFFEGDDPIEIDPEIVSRLSGRGIH